MALFSLLTDFYSTSPEPDVSVAWNMFSIPAAHNPGMKCSFALFALLNINLKYPVAAAG